MHRQKPEIHTFPNGLRFVYEQHPSKIPKTHIRAFCHVGSIHEPDEIRGASHFIEHMCFKGSKLFHNWSEVNTPFSQSGAYFNATTTKQYTCYTIDCLDSYVHHFLNILGDMLLHSIFDKNEYKKELNVVREEVKMRTPDSFTEYLAFSGSLYENWVDHTDYHKPGCLPYNAVVDYYHQYYVPNNMVLSIVSSVSFETLIRYISTTPFNIQLSRKIKNSPILNVNLGNLIETCESVCITQPSTGETTRIEIGVRVCDQTNESDANSLIVLRHIISSTMSSRMFVELREKRGLTYRSGSYMNLYESTGVFVLYAVSDVDRLIDDPLSKQKKNNGVVPVMFDILEDLVKNGIKDSELKMAKQNIKETLKMESIASGDKASYNGIRLMLHNDTDILPNSDIYEKHYKKITKKDVNDVINKYFAPKIYYFSIIGGKLPKASKLNGIIPSNKK